MKGKTFLLYIALLFSVTIHAQEFGGTPPFIKWKQIDTDTVRVIFPPGLEQQATQIANISEALSRKTIHSIGNRTRKINIVLQNQTTISNAYVALGPYRSEFHSTPQPNSFELGSLPWIQSLAIHEYRHIQQYNNFRKGIASVFYFAFGEEGQALANALTIPDWFFEGDAVYHETQVSRQGRGRIPYFYNDFRALWAAGKDYSYMKLRNGSLRDFVPSHYPLGYMLVAYGREKYGEEFWKNVVSDAAGWKGLLYPFQKAVRKYSGIRFNQFRTQALASYKDTSRSQTSVHSHFVADEEYPYWIDSVSVVYMKSTYNQRPAFVIRTNNQEKKVRIRDVSIDNHFSYRNGKIVYASFRPDTRWGWRDYTELKIIDIKNGSQSRFTRKTKYFSPDISEDGNSVVAVDINTRGNASLHIIEIRNGRVIKNIANPDELFYTYPKFFGPDKIVSAVRNREGKMSVAVVDHTNGKSTYILPFTWTVIGFPFVEKNSIYFSASFEGNDKIFRWENDQLYIVQATTDNPHNTGDYQVNVLNDKLVWTRLTATGYRLMFSQEDKKEQTTLQPLQIEGGSNRLFRHTSPDSLHNFLSTLESKNYKITNYSKSFRLFNFHSRRPYINDPDYTFSFVSENILNTLQSEFFASYNRNEKFKQLGFSALYGGWFPLLNIGTQYTFDRNAIIRSNAPRSYWNEWETNVGFSVPLNLSQGKMFTHLTAGSDYVFNKRYLTGYYKDSFDNRAFGYINVNLRFSNQIQRARQHINPRVAQTLTLNYKNAVTNVQGSQFLVSGNFYIPGIFQNHSIVLQAAWHRRDTLSRIRFSNSFPFSRGYSTNNFHQMWKVGGNYHFPIAYPDWGFGNIIYFLRIRSNLFFDFTRIKDYNTSRRLISRDFRSYGTEIFFDTKWWNQLPISFGIRYSRLLDNDIDGRTANQFEFVLPVNLLNR